MGKGNWPDGTDGKKATGRDSYGSSCENLEMECDAITGHPHVPGQVRGERVKCARETLSCSRKRPAYYSTNIVETNIWYQKNKVGWVNYKIIIPRIKWRRWRHFPHSTLGTNQTWQSWNADCEGIDLLGASSRLTRLNSSEIPRLLCGQRSANSSIGFLNLYYKRSLTCLHTMHLLSTLMPSQVVILSVLRTA